jgi:hypothetical protein
VVIFERELGNTGFIELAQAFGDHPVVLFLYGARERRSRFPRELTTKIVGDFIARESVSVLTALHYELEQISKSEILRKLKQRFGGKTIRDILFALAKLPAGRNLPQ